MLDGTIQFYPYRLIEENDKKYVFSGNNSGIFEVGDDALSLIGQEGKTYSEAYAQLAHTMAEGAYEALLDKMERACFLRTPENDSAIEQLRDGGKIRSLNSIVLFLVQDCNLHCTYCYGSGGEYQDKGVMDLATAKKAVDLLAENAMTDRPKITFFGGEPLLNFGLIKQLVPYIRAVEKQCNKSFLMGMTTNGTLLDAERRAYLEENKISCMISMDGDRQVQDANRCYSDGRGSYDVIMEQTEDMRAKGQLSCRATVTPVSLDITESFRHLTEAGFSNIFFAEAKNSMTPEDYEEYGRQFVRFIEELKNMVQNGEYETVKKASNLMNYLYFVHNGGIRKSCCGVGGSLVAIDRHGDIYPCQRFVSEKEFCIGSVFKGGLAHGSRKNFLDAVRIEKHTQCEDCWAKNLCMGDCAYENLMSQGSVSVTPECVCRQKKSVFEAVIRLYLHLPEAFKKSLDWQ